MRKVDHKGHRYRATVDGHRSVGILDSFLEVAVAWKTVLKSVLTALSPEERRLSRNDFNCSNVGNESAKLTLRECLLSGRERTKCGDSARILPGRRDNLRMFYPFHRKHTGRQNRSNGQKRRKSWRTRQDSNLWPLPSEGSALSS